MHQEDLIMLLSTKNVGINLPVAVAI